MRRFTVMLALAATFLSAGLQARESVKSSDFFATQDSVLDSGRKFGPPAPQIEVQVETASCEVFRYDYCGPFEQNCHGTEYRDGTLIAKGKMDKTYSMRVVTRNAYIVWDDCGLFEFFPDGQPTDDLVEWSWNGPYTTATSHPANFTAVGRERDHREISWLNRVIHELNPLPSAFAFFGGTAESYTLRTPGTFECKAYAMGKNFQMAEVSFTYSCTENGGDASPR